MKRPAFQFYVKDWRNNLKLRRCSEAARGAWIDLLCYLHDSEEYGVLRWPLKEIASTTSTRLVLVRELATKGVLKGGEKDVPAYTYTPHHAGKALPTVTLLEASHGPMWYCSRFVRDEWARARRGESTRFTPDHQPPRNTPQGGSPTRSPTRRQGEPQGDGPAVASASAVQSLKEHLKLAEGENPQPVDNPPAEAGRSTPKASAQQWWKSDDGIVAEGKRRGIAAKLGESMEAYRQRLFQTKDRAA